MVEAYQTALEAILKDQPPLERCAVCCVHCGIRFLTSVRNAGRRDLRCPFGCRKHHRRQQANHRNRAYRQTQSGRRKKKRLNARRQSCDPGDEKKTPQAAEPTSPEESTPEESTPEESTSTLEVEGVSLEESTLPQSCMLPYLQTAIKLIEGVWLSRPSLIDGLRLAMRQRSMLMRTRIEYVLEVLDLHPP